MEVEVIEAEFMSPVLLSKATVRLIDFKRERQEKLIGHILKNANLLLGTLDRVNDLENPAHLEAAIDVVEEMINAQEKAALQVTTDKLEAMRR